MSNDLNCHIIVKVYCVFYSLLFLKESYHTNEILDFTVWKMYLYKCINVYSVYTNRILYKSNSNKKHSKRGRDPFARLNCFHY